MLKLPSKLRSWPKLRLMLSLRAALTLAAALPHLAVTVHPLLATTMLRSEPRARMKTTTVLLRSMLRSREKRLFSLSFNLKSMLTLRAALSLAAALLPHLAVTVHPLLATTMPRLELKAMTHTTMRMTWPRSMLRSRLKLSKPSKKRPLSTLPTSCHRLALRTPSFSWLSLVTASHRSRLA